MVSKKPLVVLDTSVFISAYLSSNELTSPNKILNLWQQSYFILIVTPSLIEELILVLQRKKVDELYIISLVEKIREKSLIKRGIYETNYLDNIDPKDNIFLSACYEGKADYLVSLDKHLLNLKHFHQTLIFNPQSFLNQIYQYNTIQ
ncbi:putative toxin-antitoxin system toxin component, PIN family [Geminocystis sp. CENA526]|uniref:putative toxin-antitoxin system toxin component, PIN family n=1 Tax=Geminocystis sp. CENA526 TaxID=1355871 RepID=UPI003D6DE273